MSHAVPTILKKLAGNPGKHALPENELVCREQCSLEPSDWLTDEGKKQYRRLRAALFDTGGLGLLSEIDKASLECLCEAYSSLVSSTEAIKIHGRVYEDDQGNPKIHPAVRIQNQAMAAIRQFALEFGMTPSARGRLHIADQNAEEDPMGALLRS